MKFELHAAAQKDLEKAIDFYVDRAGKAVAERFVNEFHRAANFIANNPERISKSKNGHRSYSLRVFPYSLVYVVVENCVRILVVRHHRRKPSFGMRRSF